MKRDVIAELDASLAEIQSHIKPGDLQGDGLDKCAERNGLILAYNLLMKRREKVARQMATDTPARTVPANPESQCPLAPSTVCRQALWCHDKNRPERGRIAAGAESRAERALPGNGLSTRERVAAVKRDRASAFSSPAVSVSLAQSPRSRQRLPIASAASHAARSWLVRRLGLSHLRWLETLQALSRLRCWLLRSCLCRSSRPPVNAFESGDSTPEVRP